MAAVPGPPDHLRRDAPRRDAIDVARVGALAMVVAGHLLLAVIDRGPDGALRGANLLSLHPDLAWLSLLAPMPVFFAAAGWANASGTVLRAAPRLRTLVGLGAVVVLVWYVPAMVERLATGERGVLGDGARIATQPLWFLAAYLPFAASGARLAALARRPVVAVGSCLVLVAVLDLARFGGDAPQWIGWFGFLPAWGVPWLLGAWWRDQRFDRRRERRTGALIALVAAVVGAVLVWRGGYEPALIDAVAGRRSNTTPPTLFTAVAAVAQVGVLLVLAGALDRVGARRRAAVRAGNRVAVGVYVWHLTALALCSGVVALGLAVPERSTGWWWVTRPLWWAAVLAVTAALVAASAGVRQALVDRRLARPPGRERGAVEVSTGVVLAAVGAALVGLRGPSSVATAAVALGALLSGWWLLPAPEARPDRPPSGTSTVPPPRG
jgi:hypothetical protein